MSIELSVIIPSYKPGDYIEKCLSSVAGQTLQHERFEVIVVLNGCREPYYSHVEQLLKDSGLNATLLQTDTAGVSNARNIGLEAAQGNYLAFIDDDDWLSSNYLANLLACVTPEGIAVSNVHMIDDATGKQLPNYVARAYTACSVKSDLQSDSRGSGDPIAPAENRFPRTGRSFLSSACEKIIPKAVIDSARFPTNLSNGEDAVFMFEISKRIKRLTLCPEDTIYYIRKRSSSLSRNHFSLATRLSRTYSLTAAFTRIYLSDIRHYSFFLYLTRVAATIRRWLLTSRKRRG